MKREQEAKEKQEKLREQTDQILTKQQLQVEERRRKMEEQDRKRV